MKINAIKLIEGPHKLHYAKTAESKVFLPIELGDEIYNKISDICKRDAHFDMSTEYLDTPLTFYPHSSETTLMNFGPYTSVLRNSASVSDIAAQMYEHTNKVLKLNS